MGDVEGRNGKDTVLDSAPFVWCLLLLGIVRCLVALCYSLAVVVVVVVVCSAAVRRFGLGVVDIAIFRSSEEVAATAAACVRMCLLHDSCVVS